MVSGSRETTFDTDIADPRELEEILRSSSASCARPGQARAPRAHDRDQGPPRRLHDGHPRRTLARRSTRPTASAGGAGLLRRTRPAAGAAARRAGGRPRAARRRGRGPADARARDVLTGVSTGRRRACGATRAPAGARRRARRARRRPRGACRRAAPSALGDRRDQRVQARSLVAARRARRTRRRGRAPAAGRVAALERDPRGQAVGGERAGDVARAPRAPRRARRGRAAAGQRDGGVGAAGSSSSARRSESSSPAATSASASEGSSGRGTARPGRGGCAPTNSSTTFPSLNALTAGIDWIRKRARDRGLASVSTLASSTLPARASAACSITGPSCRHGPHHSAQKSTTTGSSCERWMTAAGKWPR